MLLCWFLLYNNANQPKLCIYHFPLQCFPGGSDSKESACNAEDLSSILELGRHPGVGNGNPLQYSCLENPWTEEPGRLQSMGSQSHTWLKQLTLPLFFPLLAIKDVKWLLWYHSACGQVTVTVFRLPDSSVGKESAYNAGDTRDAGSIPGSGRSSGEGHGNPLQSCLENPVERGAWRAIVHGVTKRHDWVTEHSTA